MTDAAFPRNGASAEAYGLDAQSSAAAPLDAAVEYVRRRYDRVLPLYALAMAPHAVCAVLLIDVLVAGQRRPVPVLCVGLLAATLWRWAVLAWMQRGIQADLRGVPGRPFFRRLPAVLWLRLVGGVAMTWGLFLIVPPLYGVFIGTFAAPLLYESDDAAWSRLRACVSWTNAAAKRLVRGLLVMLLVSQVLMTAVMATQAMFTHIVLSSLLGQDVADLVITLDSPSWQLRLLYFTALALDAFWAVAGVFVYYDAQSRRMATDLRVRLTDLTGAAT